jgi:hypothetical protein
VAPYAPPDEKQRRAYAFFATAIHQRYGHRGHFRPWAKLSFPSFTRAYRFVYPTLLCAGTDRAFLHDVRTGALVQSIDIGLEDVCYVDVDERYVFVCEPDVLHVFSRGEGGAEVLRIPRGVLFSKVVGPSTPIDRLGDPFVSVLTLYPGIDEYPPVFIAGTCVWHRNSLFKLKAIILFLFCLAHVSRDGHDLVILTTRNHVFLIRDFERISRGETSLETAGPVLHLSRQAKCFYLAFEHGRVCVATVRAMHHFFPGLHALMSFLNYFQSLGLFIFPADMCQDDSTDLTRVVFVQPFAGPAPRHSPDISCMQLTDRRVYFTWDDERRRDVPLYKDEENELGLSSPTTPSMSRVDPEFGRHHHL